MGKELSFEAIRDRIVVLRGQRVMLSTDLAALYGVPAKVLIQAVKRNRARFPADFMFTLTAKEASRLRSQIVTLDGGGHRNLRSQIVTSRSGRGGRILRSQIVTLRSGHGRHSKYPPLAFTEHGITMLSSVLRSPRAIAINIQVVRAFVQLRHWLISNRQLGERVEALEKTVDGQFKILFAAIEELWLLLRPRLAPRSAFAARVTRDG